MCAKWVDKSENSVDVLAGELENHRLFDDSGKHTGWKAFEFDDYTTAIESYLIFNDQIPQYERYLILNRAISFLAKTQKLSAKGILGSVNREENLYLNKPKLDYVLATSISINYFDELKKENRKGKFVKFTRRLSRRFDQTKAIRDWKLYRLGEFPQTYTSIQIPVKARSEREAFNVAIDELDLIRGIWNLRLNGEVLFSFSRTGAEPINKVRLGALHTLHFTDGKPATSGFFWFEPDYIEKTTDLSRNWKELKLFEKRLRKHLSKHLYRNDMEDAIRRYVRALDYRDLHISFLELWILLEKLTATTNAQYEKMVKRVAFLYIELDLHKQVVQHLRLYRNSNIHTGQRSERISKYVYQLKRYVETLMDFHIKNYFKFNSIEEAASFLDLPNDTNTLKDRIKLLNKGIKFRSS